MAAFTTLLPLIVWSLTVAASPARAAAAAAEPTAGGLFTYTQGRVLDTRSQSQVGAYSTPMSPNVWRTIQIGGLAGVPSSGVSAVHVNLTAANTATTSGFFQTSAAGVTPSTTTSSLHYGPNATESNLATVPVSAGGAIQVRASTAVNIIIDVQGYYATGSTTAGGFVPVTPTRFVDTRYGTGAPTGQLQSNSVTSLQVGGVAGVPAGASAAVVSVAIVSPSSNGSFDVWPSDAPNASLTGPSTGFNGAVTVDSIEAVIPLSATGAFKFRPRGASIHLVADVVGYFVAGSSGGGFVPQQVRALDTKASGQVAIPANSTKVVRIEGVGQIPNAGAAAAVLNIAAVNTFTTGGLLNVYAHGTVQPSTSSLNYPASRTVSNMVVTALGEDGAVSITNQASHAIDVVVDVQGYYTPVVTDPQSDTVVADAQELPAEVVANMDRTSTPEGQAAIQDANATAIDPETQTQPMSVFISRTSTIVAPTSMAVTAVTGENVQGEHVTEFIVEMGGAVGSDEAAGYAVPPSGVWRYFASGFYKDKVGKIWGRKVEYNVNKANNYRTSSGQTPYDYYRATSKMQGYLLENSYKGYSQLWYYAVPKSHAGQPLDDFEIATPDSPINGSSTTTKSVGYANGVEVSLGIPPVGVSASTTNSYQTSSTASNETMYPIVKSPEGSGGVRWCQNNDADVRSPRTIVNRVSYRTNATGNHVRWNVQRGTSNELSRCPGS